MIEEKKDGTNEAFRLLSETLEMCKITRPGDRSMQDRAFAIVITDLEKVLSYYRYWILGDTSARIP